MEDVRAGGTRLSMRCLCRNTLMVKWIGHTQGDQEPGGAGGPAGGDGGSAGAGGEASAGMPAGKHAALTWPVQGHVGVVPAGPAQVALRALPLMLRGSAVVVPVPHAAVHD